MMAKQTEESLAEDALARLLMTAYFNAETEKQTRQISNDERMLRRLLFGNNGYFTTRSIKPIPARGKVQLNFYCSGDGTPMDVYLHYQNQGAAFGINDDDNDQRKQVLLSYRDTVKLSNALREFIA